MSTQSRAIRWRCFHCGECFTRAQQPHAAKHFGYDEGATPVCLMRVPGEEELLTVLRKAEIELARYRDEDNDLMRAIFGMRADHQRMVRNAEEKGYASGLRDGRNESRSHSPVATPEEVETLFSHGKDVHTVPVIIIPSKLEVPPITDITLSALPKQPTICGWTGKKCPNCRGSGESNDDTFGRRSCMHCGGTGKEYVDPPDPQ